jgi:uncharacterized membrane protein
MSPSSDVSITGARTVDDEGYCHKELDWADRGVRQRMASTQEPNGSISWQMQRNCSMKPGHMLCVLILIALPSALIGMGFFLKGATWVTFFSGLELFVLAAVFFAYARHAADNERVRVVGSHVEVQVRQGSTLHTQRFNRKWVSICMPQSAGGLLVLRESGRSMAIGRHIPRHLRGDFYQALSAELDDR